MRYRRRSYRDFEDDDLDLIGENLVAVTDRLDDLARQVARLARRRDERDSPADPDDKPERAARRRYEVSTEERADSRDTASRDDETRPVPHWLPESDPAVDDNSVAPKTHEPASPEPAPALVPVVDLSGLESQLRHITAQLAELHQPCRIDDAVIALRSDLAEVSRAFNEAMPRQAIEVLEKEVRGLAESVDRSRESGAEVAQFAQLERGLAEIRDNLRNIKPAEHLVEITQAVRHLAHRIEQVAAATQNPAVLAKFDQAIAGLRVIVSHVASNDTVGKLADEIRGLSTRFEQAIAENGAKALSNFDRQIATLIEGSRAVSPELKSLIKSVGEQVNQTQPAEAQLSQSDKLALSNIEDRIVKLSGKLDDSDAWLARLCTIERGIGDLLIYLEDQRRGSPSLTPQESAHETAHAEIPETPQAASQETSYETPQARKIESLHDRMSVKSAAAAAAPESSIKSEATVEAAEEALEAAFTPPTSTNFIPPLPVQALPMETIVTESPSPNLAPNGTFSHEAAPSAIDALNEAIESKAEPLISPARRPINPDLPPDTPIEPSPESASPRASAADRITASEAALGTAKPVAREVATQFETLIAARRAAFAAGAETAGANVAPFKPLLAEGAEQLPEKSPWGGRVRVAFFVVVFLVIVLAAARVAMEFWPSAEPSAPMPAPAGMPVPSLSPDAPVAPATPVAPAPSGPAIEAPDGVKNPPALNQAPMPMPAPESAPMPPPQDPPVNNLPPNSTPMSPPNGSSPDPLGDAGSGKAMPDVTGALNRAGADPSRANIELPATIGGPFLRTAALGGNSAAEYEIAVRYLEGRGVTANVDEAARWLERSARTGFAPALFRLGGLYDKGGGLKRDRALARQLYAAAAEKGHAKAMHNLAVLYAEGFDGKPNYRLAAYWFRKAADYGIADSQYNLAILYIRGIGIDQNLAESYKWFALAAEQGDQEAAKKRDEVVERLDEQALNAAQVAVQTFNALQQPEVAVGLKMPTGGWDRGTASAQPPQPPAKPKGKSDPLPNTLLSPAPL